jgi:CheY-like chemotaxis protein
VAVIETGYERRHAQFCGRRLPPGTRVLLVEDYDDARETIAELLEVLGYRVTAVPSLAAAQAVRTAPDVIVSDVHLPDGSGCDLIRGLRSRAGWEDVPAIALSGYDDPEDLDDAAYAGFLRYLVKPVAIYELDRALQETAARGAGVGR